MDNNRAAYITAAATIVAAVITGTFAIISNNFQDFIKLFYPPPQPRPPGIENTSNPTTSSTPKNVSISEATVLQPLIIANCKDEKIDLAPYIREDATAKIEVPPRDGKLEKISNDSYNYSPPRTGKFPPIHMTFAETDENDSVLQFINQTIIISTMQQRC